MNLTKRRILIYIILTAICIFLITAGIIKKNNTDVVLPDPVPEKTDAVIKPVPSTVTADNSKKTKFTSNDEIKQKYGKLETVTLWNGKSYTGAVVNTEKVYSIITIDGLINIPMKEVKIREIIR
ncbi:MAG: hypothetical protein CVV49_07630 [Spirochaetae bacterium HGW-Spirochaetae-5]|nr:MAG: hypothetical protein CVV49_07630 [Spirochaetae bacterium HGW-Spirochaetae-5]